MNLIWLLFAAMFFLSLAGFIASWLPGVKQGALGRFRWLAIPLAAVCFVGLHTVPFETHQFKITVTVDTPEGPKSGSSIIRVVSHWGLYGRYMSSNIHRWFRHRAHGTAPIVGMGQYGTLVAALGGVGDRDGLHFRSILTVLRGVAKDNPRHAQSHSFPEIASAVSPTKFYPPLLYLPVGTDNPRAFKQLAPSEFPAIIGNGVSLESIVIRPAPNSSFKSRIQDAPKWLWNIRRDNTSSGTPKSLSTAQRKLSKPGPGYRISTFETGWPPTFFDRDKWL